MKVGTASTGKPREKNNGDDEPAGDAGGGAARAAATSEATRRAACPLNKGAPLGGAQPPTIRADEGRGAAAPPRQQREG